MIFCLIRDIALYINDEYRTKRETPREISERIITIAGKQRVASVEDIR